MFHYIYILRSKKFPEQTYIGYTTNLEKRLNEHNENQNPSTTRYSPWEIETYIALKDKYLALNLERYLKHGSGKAFMKKRMIRNSN